MKDLFSCVCIASDLRLGEQMNTVAVDQKKVRIKEGKSHAKKEKLTYPSVTHTLSMHYDQSHYKFNLSSVDPVSLITF